MIYLPNKLIPILQLVPQASNLAKRIFNVGDLSVAKSMLIRHISHADFKYAKTTVVVKEKNIKKVKNL